MRRCIKACCFLTNLNVTGSDRTAPSKQKNAEWKQEKKPAAGKCSGGEKKYGI